MQDVEPPLISKETSDPSLQAAIMHRDDARGGIKALPFLQGVLLDAVAEGEQWWEGVCELHETDCGSHTCKPEEIGDGGGNDESDGPVDGDDDCPEDLAAFGNESWRVEPLHEEIVIDHFNADIAVQSCCD